MHLFSFYPEASEVGETHNLVSENVSKVLNIPTV
jgi:hypothetical protein